jgi:hypothetical protein
VKVLARSDAEMFELVEDDAGRLVLEIVVGGFAMVAMRVPLTDDEVRRVREEGDGFVRWLVDSVNADPRRFER